MAGKPYSMREMRAIVEYLTERKAYGEIKGRKMWMEYANSEKTVRTWQSLKETFIKRILPDIQNPYYKLTMDQVRSFRQGYDVAEREKNNRLEFRTASEDSNGDNKNSTELTTTNNKENPTTSNDHELPAGSFDIEPPTTSIDEELEKATGEGITCAKIPSRSRSSADTVVLEYENADDLQRALESPKNDENEDKPKSLKDLLTFEYTAPLTPIVRNLLEDFETESEASDKEPQLNIDENRQETAENIELDPMVVEEISSENRNVNNESPIEIHDTEDSANVRVNSKNEVTSAAQETPHKYVQEKSPEPQKNKSLQLKKTEKNIKDELENTHEPSKETSVQNNDITDADSNNITEFVTAESNAKTFEKSADMDEHKKNSNNTTANNENSLQNTGNTSSDTILPNNQEALDGSKKSVHKTNLDKAVEDVEKVNKSNSHSKTGYLEKESGDGKGTGKRLTSQNGQESKKQKISNNPPEESKENEISIPIIEIHDTPTEHDNISVLEKNTSVPDMKIIEMNTNTPAPPEKQCNDLRKEVPKITDKPSTSSKKDILTAFEGKNPCLLSVSLFDEQFKNTKYSDSDSDDEATPLPDQNLDKGKAQSVTNNKKQTEEKPEKELDKMKETALKTVEKMQKSGGVLEFSADCEPQRQMVDKTNNVDNKVINLQREKALANVFGFAHGIGALTSRKRHVSHRRRSHHYRRRHSKNNDSNSSEWTSDSDSESYVSPPRGRKNRHTRKYLKPKSSRILQDPEEGMLYVIFGKNIYPLVKDGTHIKNFLTYRPDSGSDIEEESYWKRKYVDEKKRVEDVKKLLKESQERRAPQMNAPTSPILPSPSRISTHSQQKSVQNANSKDLIAPPKIENKTEPDSKMVLKIAAKDGLEYCLEGGWTQISNAMPQMVRMLQSETTAPSPRKSKSPNSKTVELSITDGPVDVSSGVSTPVIRPNVDPEVHEKVDKLEKEIFKEIEELEKERQLKQNETERNITKRKPGRPRKESSSSSVTVTQSPARKRARASKTNSTETKQESTKPTRNKRISKPKLDVPEQIESKPGEVERPTTRAKSKATVQRNLPEQSTETAIQKESNPIMRPEVIENEQNDNLDRFSKRRASLRISKQKDTADHNGSVGGSEVSLAAGTRSSARLVKTPKKYDTDSSASDIRLRSMNSTSKETTALIGFDDENARFMFPPTSPVNKITSKGKKNRSFPKINVIPPQENTSGNSVDTTQGYQDSDGSPIKLCLPRRKKRGSLSIQKKYKNKRLHRRKSHPKLLEELLSDSNNSSYFVPLRRSQSTLNSEVYRTESFQLLLPKEKRSFYKLERIDETSHIDPNIRHFDSVSQHSDKSHHENSNIVVEIASSSGVSLPLSPELSVVENLSISRDMIKSDNHPTINEIQLNASSHAMDISEYMISNIDVSVPLMNQQCELQKSTEKLISRNKAKSTPSSHPPFGRECSVRIENLTLSETLDQRLRDLLLESSKKTTVASNNRENAMEVDQTKTSTAKKIRTRAENSNAMDVDEPNVTNTVKTRAKKRSSTPQKKKNTQKKKAPETPVIEEEHMESCTFAGRKSCPPVMTHLPIVENANNFLDDTHNTIKVKTKKKKDIIRVKISRPNTRSKEKLRESVENVSVTSTYTDSGINETGTVSGEFLKESEDNIDLIHNHSETCLLANECMGDSVQFVENSNSIISLSSSEQSVLSELQKILDDAASLSGELFDINPRDDANSDPRTSEEIFESPETVYHTPAATNSSLITEDLSDDPPTLPTQWHLVSEDENTQPAATSMASYGANLMQIFKSYAVPDLSTISEISKENDDSRKPNFDTDGDTVDSNLQNVQKNCKIFK